MAALSMKVYFFLFLYLLNVEATVFHLQHTSGNINIPITQTPSLQIYTARVKLGNPPQNFTVLIDTGSDITWVPCKSCSSNTTCSALVTIIHQFNTNYSISEKLVSCPQKWCSCSDELQCKFGVSYADQTSTSGFFIQDSFSWMDAYAYPSSIIFGCSIYLSAFLLEGTGYDGILGFGRGPLSLPSQLGLNGFSHCFNLLGRDGFFLLGEALLPNLTYTPMAPSTLHFDLYLEKIMVNGQTLAILVLESKQYFKKEIPEIMENSTTMWCINILAWQSRTILGVTILKNKLVVYDVSRQRVGWADFNCSMSAKALSVNLSMVTTHNNTTPQENKKHNTARQLHIRWINVVYAFLITFTILFR